MKEGVRLIPVRHIRRTPCLNIILVCLSYTYLRRGMTAIGGQLD